MRFIAILVFLFSCFPLNSYGHALAPGLLELQESEQGLSLRWKVSRKGSAYPLSPKLPDGCQLAAEPHYEISDQAIEVKGRLDCGALDSLVGQVVSANNIERNVISVLVRYRYLDGSVASHLISRKDPLFTVPAQMGRLEVFKEYLLLGIDHLLFGYDHVIFVLALLLLIRSVKKLVLGITFFTLGHSITLALSTLKIVTLPTALVEIAIAGSIVFLAAEIFHRRETPSLIERKVWMLPLAFGLLHGMGFASALSETGVPANEIPAALLAFNIGIELGQLLIVAVFLLVKSAVGFLLSMKEAPLINYLLLQRLAAYGIGSISAFWVIERSVGLFV